jgi:hypothetical protein
MTTASGALCRFDRILAHLGSDGTELADGKRRVMHDISSSIPARGRITSSATPSRCFAVSYYTSKTKCLLIFVEFDGTGKLEMIYEYAFHDSGGTVRYSVLCDKDRITPEVATMLETAKITTTGYDFLGPDVDNWVVRISYGKYCLESNCEVALSLMENVFYIPRYFFGTSDFFDVGRFRRFTASFEVIEALRDALVTQMETRGELLWIEPSERPSRSREVPDGRPDRGAPG